MPSWIGGYPYTCQLMALDQCRESSGYLPLPNQLASVTSPVNLDFWKEHLRDHEDQIFSQLVLQGLIAGFRIGFQREAVLLRSARSNMISASTHQEVVSAYLEQELKADRIALVGTVDTAHRFGIHISPFGVIPKKGKPNKWRLILDLSSPSEGSVNDGIPKEWCSLQYVSVSVVAARIVGMGKGTLMGKMDIQQAYRNIPVAAEDRRLLGMFWQGKVYVDKVLPFGLRSAPLIFSTVADALEWIMLRQGVTWVAHYLDDFLTVGNCGSSECQDNMSVMTSVCGKAGLPIESSKTVGPAANIIFLGMELDSWDGVIRLPADKLQDLKRLLRIWREKKACRKRELLSLLGILNHACKAVRAGRSFLRRLIDLSTSVKKLDHFIRLNVNARSDIEWWYQFAQTWNGVSLLSSLNKQSPAAIITSDASGSWGCGAVCGKEWFHLSWDGMLSHSHITVKELTPVVIAVAVWGQRWKGESLLVRSDNMATVSIINSGTSHNKEAMHLTRSLAFIAAKFQLTLSAEHVPGDQNTLADALSRNNLPLFYSLLPQAQKHQSQVPKPLLDLLLIKQPDWTSKQWTDLWNTIFPPG